MRHSARLLRLSKGPAAAVEAISQAEVSKVVTLRDMSA